MAFRSRTRRRGARKTRDLIWVNKIAEFTVNDTLTVGGEILTSNDWQTGASESFERSTLLRIVGCCFYNQVANATSADVPYTMWALYKDAAGIASGFPAPTSPTFMATVDVLRWSGFMLASTASGTLALMQREEIDITTKRKLSSGDSIYIAANIPTDTVSPTVNLVFALRFLVDRA